MKLTIMIPARNEQETVINTLEKIKREVKIPYEIIVINDYSTDSTEEVVRKYTFRNSQVKIINNRGKKGFANALQLGFKNAQQKIIVVVMADLCDDPETINRMYKKMKEGYDIVCGSRYMEGGKKIGGRKIQNLFSELVCRSLALFTGIPTQDVSNAFKMYRKEILQKVKMNSESGVEASMEITFQVFFNGAKITEIPTTWKGRTKGLSKFKIIERLPRYFKIYNWALENAVRKRLGFSLKKFY